MSSKTPSTYTVSRLRILYKVFFEQYGFMKPHILAFLNWLEARGEKIDDNTLAKRM